MRDIDNVIILCNYDQAVLTVVAISGFLVKKGTGSDWCPEYLTCRDVAV
jgi:hypothetical protein